MVHFSWRKRSNLQGEADLDLVIIGDARFVPYTKKTHKGRIFALRFTSGESRHFFWLQSAPQTRDGDAAFLSDRDKKIGDAVDRLCRGEATDVDDEVAEIRAGDTQGGDGDDDTAMEDVDGGSGSTEQAPTNPSAPPASENGGSTNRGTGTGDGGASGGHS